MVTTQQLTQEKINALTRFVTKHHVIEITLNKAESKYFFDYLENSSDLERSRILVQPAFAEGYMYDSNNNLIVSIIHRSQILGGSEIKWEDGYDDRINDNKNHVNPFTRRMFEIFIEKMGLDLLIEKIADRLSLRFPLSRGQASAIITKYMGFTLDSGTRSFLHDLRKKIRKYQLLISEFQEYVLENERPELIPLRYMNQVLQSIESGNINELLEEIPDEWINRPTENRLSEFHSVLEERRSISEGDKEMGKLEKRFGLQNEPGYEFICQECDESRPFIPDETETSVSQSPQHHGKPMIIRVIKGSS